MLREEADVSHARAFGVAIAVALLAAASLITVLVLAQPTSQHSARRFPAVRESPAILRTSVWDLREVNYYPASGGWTYMWSHFDPAAIDRDFARIRALDANTVRIIIQPSVFGFPMVR